MRFYHVIGLLVVFAPFIFIGSIYLEKIYHKLSEKDREKKKKVRNGD